MSEPKAKRPRATKADKFRRARDVEKLMMRGITNQTIVDIYTTKWGISAQGVMKYITQTIDKWRAADDAMPQENRISVRRQQLEGMLELAMKQDPPDFRTGVVILDRLCKVDNVFAAQVVKVTGGVAITAMTNAEKNRELQELMQKYAIDIGERFAANLN